MFDDSDWYDDKTGEIIGHVVSKVCYATLLISPLLILWAMS